MEKVLLFQDVPRNHGCSLSVDRVFKDFRFAPLDQPEHISGLPEDLFRCEKPPVLMVGVTTCNNGPDNQVYKDRLSGLL